MNDGKDDVESCGDEYGERKRGMGKLWQGYVLDVEQH